MLRTRVLVTVGLVWVLLGGQPILAVVERPDLPKTAILLEGKSIASRPSSMPPAERTPAGAAARGFLGRHGGQWEFQVDRRTGRQYLVQGSGIPWIPGKGNALGAEALAALGLADGELTPQALEPSIRSFIASESALIAPPVGALVLNANGSAVRDDGRLVSLSFDWHVGGLPVEGAQVLVRLNSGNITQFGSRLIGPIDIDTIPAFDGDGAVRRLLDYTGDEELYRLVGMPELMIQPESDDDRLDYRLIWKVTYRLADGIETWEGRLDAHTGEMLSFRDTNHYARATGGVFPRTVFFDNEVISPLPFVNVTVDGNPMTTDDVGAFPYTGGMVSSDMDGFYFAPDCQGCTSPAQPGFQIGVGAGRVHFGTGGQDEVGNGLSTAADRNTFYHLNQVRRVALKWVTGLGWLDTTNYDINTNIDNTCNAVFGGDTINFFRGGGGCNNTGEIADVIYHEWGHGIDINTGGGDMGEGTADMTSIHMTHGPQIGPGFRVDGDPVRNVDQTVNGFGAVTFGNYVAQCGGGSHCYGQVYGQTGWELSQALVAKHGHHTGWRVSERIFFNSLFDAGGQHDGGATPIYDAYLLADDDDGNLANGTPNAEEIYAAFDAHEIASGAAPTNSPGCARPAQPALSVITSCDRFDLSWTTVAGVDQYRLFRADLREDTAYLPIADLGPTETDYTDSDVAPGVDYWYVLMAVDAAGCESPVENPEFARLPAQPVLSLVAAVDDDTPAGNRSGFADPGEDVDLFLTLHNLGEVDATGVSGTITTSTPGVTIMQGASVFDMISPDDAKPSQDVLRFTSDDQVLACGTVVEFEFVPAEASGCATETSYLSVQIGEPDGQGGFICDPTPACFIEPDFDGLAAAGSGSSCAETDLGWQPAISNCVNAEISYNIYRSATPGFAPGAGNLYIEGHPATTFTDTLLEPGETYHYVVRAYDSRSGEDSNMVGGTALAPVTPDIQPPVFTGVDTVAAGSECGETTLSWQPALETCSNPLSYEIYRSTDPAFVPGPGDLIGSSLGTQFTDAALTPGQEFTYVVRARDAAGNEGSNELRMTVAAQVTDLVTFEQKFEPNDGGWAVIQPNDATTGNWEWGDPDGTSYQSPNDASIDGVNAWITGLAAGQSGGSFDIDSGTTTLRSATYDLTGMIAPAVRYARWFTNDRGNSPGNDPFVVEVSDDGTDWAQVEEVNAGTPLEWVEVQFPLSGLVPATSGIRFRFTAEDLGDGSLVEAGLDDFALLDLGQGCTVCVGEPRAVDTIDVELVGSDVEIDWTDDPAAGTRFAVYKLSRPAFDEATAVLVGTTELRTFVHEGAADAEGDFYYRVTVIDECGNESPLVE